MEKRQPFTLYRIMQIYNVIQILLNGYFFYKVSIAFLINYLMSNLFDNNMKQENISFIIHTI